MLYADYIRKRIHHLFKVVTAAGYPITLLKSMGKPLKNYRIYGNTYWDKSDGINIIKTNSVTLSETETDISVTGDIDLSVTEKYTLAFVTVGCTYTDNTLALFEVNFSDGSTVSVPLTESYKILNEDGKTLTGIKCVNKCGCTGTVKNISCYTGRKPDRDAYSEISSVGDLNADTGKYDIPVTVHGKNLLARTGETVSSGVTIKPGIDKWVLNGKQSGSNAILRISTTQTVTLKPGTYTISLGYISGSYSDSTGTATWIGLKTMDNEWITNFAVRNSNFAADKQATFTITEETKCSWAMSAVGTFSGYTFSMQLEKGDAATGFEPYTAPKTYTISLDEPLRSVYGKTDYIDFKSKKVVRNVYEQTVRKTHLVKKNNSYVYTYGWNGYLFNLDIARYFKSAYEKYNMSTYFDESYTIYSQGLTKPYLVNSSNKYLSESYLATSPTSSETVSDFGSWIEEKYNEGKPVKIAYGRAEAIEEDVDLPEISIPKGTVIIEVNSTVSPSNMEVKYISK